MSASAYLNEQLPHLRALHNQLGLPPEQIATDEQTIEAAIRGCVEDLVKHYEDEVDQHRVKLHRIRLDIKDLVRAIGRQARTLQATGEDALRHLSLPQQVEKLQSQKAELVQMYERRLEQHENLRTKMAGLADLLGPPVEPLPYPKPISVFAKDTGRRSSASLAKLQSSSPKRQSLVQPALAAGEDCWLDVSDEAMAAAEEAIQRALEEREAKLDHLKVLIVNLAFLHQELVLPEFPVEGRDMFPQKLMPRRSTAAVSHQSTIASIIAQNPIPEDDEEEERLIAGMDGVEPEQGLMAWTQDLNDLWTEEKDRRQNRIQELYNQVEPLWMRLEMEQDAVDLFIDMNRGCGEAVIEAVRSVFAIETRTDNQYEAELDRCLELRRNSLESFIKAVRTEIEILWDELMMSEDEKGNFGPFIDDVYTEELLTAHEEEVERLRAEIESKSSILPKVREWHTLVKDEEELERLSSDPNRFSARGGALLKEEKLRKRVNMLKPKIEMEMLSLLPSWEAEHGRPFTVAGQRVVDKIHDAIEAKEAAKQAKQAARRGLAPAKTVAAARAPPASTRSVRQTPSVPGSTLRPATGRKREAPTPTPFGGGMAKRQKVAATPQISSIKPRAPARGFPNQHLSSSPSQPTPCALPRPVGRSVSHQQQTMPSMLALPSRVPSWSHPQQPTIKAVPKSRRQSFKPRQSIMHSLLLAREGMGLGDTVKEEEDGYDHEYDYELREEEEVF